MYLYRSVVVAVLLDLAVINGQRERTGGPLLRMRRRLSSFSFRIENLEADLVEEKETRIVLQTEISVLKAAITELKTKHDDLNRAVLWVSETTLDVRNDLTKLKTDGVIHQDSPPEKDLHVNQVTVDQWNFVEAQLTLPTTLPTTARSTTTARPTKARPTQRPATETDCWDLKGTLNSPENGWYDVTTPAGKSIYVNCDFTTDGGGWTVLQRRNHGTMNFSRDYSQYAAGFGDGYEFWLGNDHLHDFTSSGRQMQLRIDLCDWEGECRFAKYRTFSVGSADDKYRLQVEGYSGNAGDAISESHRSGSRYDVRTGVNFAAPGDGGREPNSRCAGRSKSGWWFGENCDLANLNGPFKEQGSQETFSGILWSTWRRGYSYRSTEMKFRPSSANPGKRKD